MKTLNNKNIIFIIFGVLTAIIPLYLEKTGAQGLIVRPLASS